MRLFRALLKLLPGEFRAHYGSDMAATFCAEHREARATSRGAFLGLWLATAGDVLRTAVTEHRDVLALDVRFALRTMAARPFQTAAVLVTLTLVLGANVALFAVVDAVLLAPLPYRDPGALVEVAQTARSGPAGRVGYLSYVDLRARSHSFEQLAAAGNSTATLVEGGREAERVNAMRVSHGYFEMFGIRPALGRTFREAEDRPGAARRVAVLSDELWRRRYGADAGILGRPLDVGGIPYVVVGVLPRGVRDLVATRRYGKAELFFPLGYDPGASYACRTCRHLGLYGRLAPGITPLQAQRELGSIFASLEKEHPSEYAGAGAKVVPLREAFLGPVRPVLLVLWVGVVALLLVGCTHVANLLLLRASGRARETAVRLALGSTRSRLARQVLTESGLLALLGGLGGGVLAAVTLRLLVVFATPGLPRVEQVALDARALGVGLALATCCGLLFAFVSLRQLLGGEPALALHGTSRWTDGRGTWALRTALVGANVALATLLLVGSGLLLRSLHALVAVAPGVHAEGVVTMRLWLGGERFRQGDNDRQIATAVSFYEELLARARAVPGVVTASAVSTLPLGGGIDRYGVHVAGRPLENPEQAPVADRFVVAPRFFEALGVPLVRGRLFDEDDRQGSASVALVNQAGARELFPGQEPIGRQISLGPPSAPRRTIIGIVGDVRHHGPETPVESQVYVPQAQWAWAETAMTLVVRTFGEPATVVAPLRALVRRLDPAQPVTDVRLYRDVVDAWTLMRRLAGTLVTCFALTALLLSLLGLYGAVGVYVGQRRREFGVRIALGAGADAIRRLAIARGLRPVAIGLPLGLLLAALGANALRSLLFEVQALDGATFAAAALLLAASAGAACALPAWRAAAIDPAETLRAE